MANIGEVAKKAGSFKTLLKAIQAAGLMETINSKGPFTVFAPTDDAFAKVDQKVLKSLLGDSKALTNVLTYHVVSGRVMAADVVKLKHAKTVQGQSVKIKADKAVHIDQAKVVQADVIADNGIIHVIDSVLLPKPEAVAAH